MCFKRGYEIKVKQTGIQRNNPFLLNSSTHGLGLKQG